jgi:hypothetical protein
LTPGPQRAMHQPNWYLAVRHPPPLSHTVGVPQKPPTNLCYKQLAWSSKGDIIVQFNHPMVAKLLLFSNWLHLVADILDDAFCSLV